MAAGIAQRSTCAKNSDVPSLLFDSRRISEWGFGLGAFRTDLYLGALTRFGWNLPVDLSDPRLSPTAYSP